MKKKHRNRKWIDKLGQGSNYIERLRLSSDNNDRVVKCIANFNLHIQPSRIHEDSFIVIDSTVPNCWTSLLTIKLQELLLKFLHFTLAAMFFFVVGYWLLATSGSSSLKSFVASDF